VWQPAAIDAAGCTIEEIRGVSDLPPAERERLYVEWCRLTRRMEPSDSTLQRDAARWQTRDTRGSSLNRPEIADSGSNHMTQPTHDGR